MSEARTNSSSRPNPPDSAPGNLPVPGPADFPRVWPVFVITAGVLALAGWRHRDALNADAIAYLRLADYYAQGRFDLAVSGYWGPLLSWCVVPLRWLGIDPLPAARVVMAGSALVFLTGVWTLLRVLTIAFVERFGSSAWLTPAWARIGLVLAAAASVSWSIEHISPDLLQGGLWLVGCALVLDRPWLERPGRVAWAGLVLGVAYLAKAIALPLALLAVGTAWLGRWFSDRTLANRGRRRAILTLVVLLLTAGPWMTVLSIRYGRPTFSTSARIAHALVGPDAVERTHPFGRMFHQPPRGRLTVWEDPTWMPYRYWSPFESRAAFWHQIAVCRQNLRTVLELWRSLDWLMLGAFAVLYGLLRAANTRGGVLSEPVAPAIILLLLLSGLYLPVALLPVDQRYFYAAWPLLWVAAHTLFQAVAVKLPPTARPLRKLLRALIVMSFGLPALLGVTFALTGLPNPASESATFLAARLRQAGISGPIGGSGMVYGGRAGLYTAYLLGQPWLGDEPDASAERYAASGARLVVVRRRQPAADALAASPLFRDLDPRLFGPGENADQFPLRVFERRE